MDNHHVHISNSMMSCGVLELSGIGSDAKKVLYAIASHLYHPSRGQPAAFVAWSDIPDSNGSKLYDFIAENIQTGGLHWTGVVENPKTSNPIRIWTWAIPHETLRTWYKQEKINRIKAE